MRNTQLFLPIALFGNLLFGQCPPSSAVQAPLVEDFTNQIVPLAGSAAGVSLTSCWTLFSGSTNSHFRWETEDATGGNDNTPETGPYYDATSIGIIGGKYLYLETNFGAIGDTAYFVSPSIDLSSLSSAELSFAYHMYGATMGSLAIQVNDGSGWANAWSLTGQQQTGGNSPWLEAVIDLSTYNSPMIIRFAGVKGTGITSDISIDNIAISNSRLCPSPSLLWANAEATSADVYWTAGDPLATMWNVEYGVQGFTIGTGTQVNGHMNDTLNITGLMPATTYMFYVSETCVGGGTSNLVGPFPFTTLCTPFATPYTEDFENLPIGTFLNYGNCWTLPNTTLPGWQTEDATGANENSMNTGPFFDNTTPTTADGVYMYFETSVGSLGSQNELITADIDVSTLTTPFVEFYYHMYGATTGALHLDVWNATLGWTNDIVLIVGQQQTAGGDSWAKNGAVLPVGYNGVVRFRFRGERGTGFTGDMSIDDFSVKEAPVCPDVSNIVAGLIQASQAEIFWNGQGGSNFNVEWGPQGYVPGSGTVIPTTADSVMITGLTPATSYDVYIQNDCSGLGIGTSNWTSPFTFTTTVSCPAPSAVAVAQSTTTAAFAWNPGGASYQNYVFGPAGTTPATGTIMTTQNDTVSASGLMPSTPYTFWVRDSCGVGDVSMWVGPLNFNTWIMPPAIAQDITVYLNASGIATITAADIDNGSSGIIGIDSIWIDNSSFDCTNLGAPVQVILTVSDIGGNTATDTAFVNVVDTTAPTIGNTAILVLDSTGNGTLTINSISITESCNYISATTISQTSFDCNDVGIQTITVTATDLSGNTATQLVQLSVFPLTNWTQWGSDIDGEADYDLAGFSVSISADGGRLAVGAYSNDGNGLSAGHTKIYEWDGNNWNQLGMDIDGETPGDNSGQSVSLSANGNRVAIGAPYNGGNGSLAGHTRIYEWNGNSWSQLGADIDGEAANDESGYSISLSANGNRVAIGAPSNAGNGSFAGHTRIFEWDGNSWIQLGMDINGEADHDGSGHSVSLSADGNRVAIGAPYNAGNGSYAGHTRIHEWDGNSWIQLGMDIDGEADDDGSGHSVSLSADGNRVAIGAPYNAGNGNFAGHTRIFEWDGNSWIQLGMDINGEATGDDFGYSVSLSSDGRRLAIGAPYNSGNGLSAGHTRIYEWDGNNWNQFGMDINSEASRDNSGHSVSMSSDGNRVAIGAPYNDGNGTRAGHTRIYLLDTISCTSVSPQPKMVTFTVDMSDVGGNYNTVNLNGDFNSWCGGCTPMTDMGNGIYQVVVPINQDSIEYKFTVDGWTSQENFVGGEPCTKTSYGFTNRFAVTTTSTELDTVCWNSCSMCVGTLTHANVTFSVDMRDYAAAGGTWTEVNLNGTFNNWCGSCAVMQDADMDSVYEIDLIVPVGLIEYKFTVDGWTDQENLTNGDPCTITTGSFTNRYLNVVQDSVVPTVCWESCLGCTVCSESYQTIAVTPGNYRVNMRWNSSVTSTYNLWFRTVGDSTWSKVDAPSTSKTLFPIAPGNYEYYVSEAGNVNPSCIGNFTINCEDFGYSSNVFQIIDATNGKINVFGLNGGRRTWDFGLNNGTDTVWAENRFSNRFLQLKPGTYTLLVKDSYDCYSSQVDTIVINPVDSSLIPNLTTVQNLGGGSLRPEWTVADPSRIDRYQVRVKDMTAGGLGTLYQTYIALGGTTTSFTINGLPPARYRIDVRGRVDGAFANGIYSNYRERVVSSSKDESTNSTELSEENQIILYPNPTQDLLYVQAPEGSELVLMDLNGKRIAVRTAKFAEEVFDLSELAQGVYILRVVNGEKVYTEKIIRE